MTFLGCASRALDRAGRARDGWFVRAGMVCRAMCAGAGVWCARGATGEGARGRRARVRETNRKTRAYSRAQTKAIFGFGSSTKADATKPKVKGYMDAGAGTQKRTPVVKKVVKPRPVVAKKKPIVKKPLIASKPKATVKKVVVAKKPLAKKAVKPLMMTKKVVAKKPVVAKKIVAKKPMMATKKVVAKKPLVSRKPMMKAKPRPAGRRVAAKKPINTTMSLKQTADLGFAGIIAGSFLLSLAILPGIADVALETIGIAYTLYFTYNYLLFEESREDFKNTLEDLESSTGIDIPAIFDSAIGAVSSITDKVSTSSSKTSYPKKADEPLMAGAAVEESKEDSSSW